MKHMIIFLLDFAAAALRFEFNYLYEHVDSKIAQNNEHVRVSLPAVTTVVVI